MIPEYDESAPSPWLVRLDGFDPLVANRSLHEVEVVVTEEMREAGRKQQAAFRTVPSAVEAGAIYRAMAAVAPVAPTWDEIGALATKNEEWHATWAATEMQRQQAVARVAELEAENAELFKEKSHRFTLAEVRALLASKGIAAFIPTPADLPPPARRPDGTLAPQQTPFPVLKQAVAARRVGG